MGFYLRKSIRVGGMRFNLSKSGIGVSSGIKGFRVGTGPRGNYVHMGGHGIYYRSSFGGSSRARLVAGTQRLPPPLKQTFTEDFHEIESGSVLAMEDSSSAGLLAEIRAKRKMLRLAPLAATFTVLAVVGATMATSPTWLLCAVLLLGAGLTGYAAFRDVLRKTVVLFFELEGDAETAFQTIHNGFDRLASCARVWHLEAEARVTDRKRHAGASGLVKRSAIRLKKGDAPFIKSNVAVPTLAAGRQTLYFFPDRVLVFDGNKVGAVDYADLRIEHQPSRFIESESVPSDSKVVDYTWQYVNKKGGPDKRFKNNRQLPIALYGELHLQSDSGLNEAFQLSKEEASLHFAQAIPEASKLLLAHRSPPALT